MRIPDGDLVPRRRHQYGGGYGRRRRLRTRWFAILAALVLIGSGVAWFLDGDDTPSASLPNSCPTPSASPSTPAVTLPAPAQVRLALLNGTPRNGLATTIRDQLVARQFVVLTTGNSAAAVAGPSVVTYGPGAQGAATRLAHHVPGAKVVSNPRAAAGSVALVLGGDFVRLATPQEVAAAERPVAAPSLQARPSPSDCPA